MLIVKKVVVDIILNIVLMMTETGVMSVLIITKVTCHLHQYLLQSSPTPVHQSGWHTHTDHHNSHSENWAGKCMCCLQRILIWTRFSYDKQPGLILFWVHYNNLTPSFRTINCTTLLFSTTICNNFTLTTWDQMIEN